MHTKNNLENILIGNKHNKSGHYWMFPIIVPPVAALYALFISYTSGIMSGSGYKIPEQPKGKPNWKQWIPYIGIYYIEKAQEENKPTIFGGDPICKGLYHGISTGLIISAPTGYGFYKLIDFL